MKLTLSWLKDHLDTSASLDGICETLTRIGLEVEHVHDPAAQLKDFVIAHVIEAKPHPNADRLRVCMVDAGAGAPVQVVCGAPNARTGLKGVFAAPGTYIPAKKITLGKGVIRGVESLGMLCSAAELELSNDHDGIIELPDDAPVGAPLCAMGGVGRSGHRDQSDAQSPGRRRRFRYRARSRGGGARRVEDSATQRRSKASSPAPSA